VAGRLVERCHCGRSRRNCDLRRRAALRDDPVCRHAVMGSVGDEPPGLARDLISIYPRINN
jgi:hypothetical protein